MYIDATSPSATSESRELFWEASHIGMTKAGIKVAQLNILLKNFINDFPNTSAVN